jgi:2'-5' RNA ligase
MTQAEPQVVTTVRNHWWWRPGWRTGRHFSACHLTLDNQPQLRELVRHYQDALAHLPGLDLIPPQWLHITMQGIGFTDEIGAVDLAAVTERLAEQLRAVEPPVATFHRATIRPEAVLLKADPPESLYQLRVAMYDAIATALGPAKFSEPRPQPGQFTPHVSAAYVNSEGPAQPIADAVSKIDPQPVTATFDTASLLVFHRDHRMYEWTQATPLPIGTARSASLSTPGRRWDNPTSRGQSSTAR